MDNKDIAFHYVCTHDEAGELIGKQTQFWVCNCGCRDNRGGRCRRSRMDVCLMFKNDIGFSVSGLRSLSGNEVNELLKEAAEKHLVSRPFRNDRDRTTTEGICFCCDDCCEYFANPDERCDKGAYVESTDSGSCNHCGTCVEVCYFNARRFNDGELKIARSNCYGCGLCADVCPDDNISMIKVDQSVI